MDGPAEGMADVLCTPWLSAYGNGGGQTMDIVGDYVPRPMLEPILEECTDDEDSSLASSVVTAPDAPLSWSAEDFEGTSGAEDGGAGGGGDNGDGGSGSGGSGGGAWSSESETGSVIRVDFNVGKFEGLMDVYLKKTLTGCVYMVLYGNFLVNSLMLLQSDALIPARIME